MAGPLRQIEHAELNPRGIDRPAHRSAQRIDLAHDLPFGHSADGRIAAHLGHGIQIRRQQRHAGAHAGGRQRRLGAGMPGPDHHDIKIVFHQRHAFIRTLRASDGTPEYRSNLRRTGPTALWCAGAAAIIVRAGSGSPASLSHPTVTARCTNRARLFGCCHYSGAGVTQTPHVRWRLTERPAPRCRTGC